MDSTSRVETGSGTPVEKTEASGESPRALNVAGSTLQERFFDLVEDCFGDLSDEDWETLPPNDPRFADEVAGLEHLSTVRDE
ncbi:MAG: hypothetical protein KDB07_06400 [Planctomycetes bacterium]|nr:hypothetical protein [Planctomycetota bacterium]